MMTSVKGGILVLCSSVRIQAYLCHKTSATVITEVKHLEGNADDCAHVDIFVLTFLLYESFPDVWLASTVTSAVQWIGCVWL